MSDTWQWKRFMYSAPKGPAWLSYLPASPYPWIFATAKEDRTLWGGSLHLILFFKGVWADVSLGWGYIQGKPLTLLFLNMGFFSYGVRTGEGKRLAVVGLLTRVKDVNGGLFVRGDSIFDTGNDDGSLYLAWTSMIGLRGIFDWGIVLATFLILNCRFSMEVERLYILANWYESRDNPGWYTFSWRH